MKKNKFKSIELKLSKILNGGLFGNYKSKFYGNGMEFAEHKQYIYGDPIKNIDWKASSKTNTLQVKKYEEERDLNVLFVLDNSNSMQFGTETLTKKDLLEEIFYFLAFSAYTNNDNIGAFIYNEKNIDFIEHKKTKNNIYRILDKISKNYSGHPQGYPLQKYILNEIVNRKIKNNLIFILTDNCEQFDKKMLKQLNIQNEIIFINIFDYFENNLIDINSNLNFSFLNKFINIDLKNKEKIDKYKKLRQEKIEKLDFDFRKNKIGYIKIDTKNDILRELLKYFK